MLYEKLYYFGKVLPILFYCIGIHIIVRHVLFMSTFFQFIFSPTTHPFTYCSVCLCGTLNYRETLHQWWICMCKACRSKWRSFRATCSMLMDTRGGWSSCIPARQWSIRFPCQLQWLAWLLEDLDKRKTRWLWFLLVSTIMITLKRAANLTILYIEELKIIF